MANSWRAVRGRQRGPFKIAASRMLHGEDGIACPECGEAELRGYHHAFDREGRVGTAWVWCPACRSTAQATNVRPFSAGDMGADPFADLGADEFRALEADRSEYFMDRLDRLWEAGLLGRGRRPKPPNRPPRWRPAGGEHQLPFMAAASGLLQGGSLPCPKCQAAELRTYFHVFEPETRRGTLWVWCPSCRTYTHLPRVLPRVDLGPDPFATGLDLGDERLLSAVDGLWNAGKLGPGKK